MGKRKRLAAEARKEELKNIASPKLNNCPTSPRKMRLVADTVRGKDVFQALNILKFSPQEASNRIGEITSISYRQLGSEELRSSTRRIGSYCTRNQCRQCAYVEATANSTSRKSTPNPEA